MALNNDFVFPFGQKLQPVIQTDLTPKKTFVLGVYASAVHARWINKEGKQLVVALTVASEPEIFWTGDDAQQQIDKIAIPEGAGKLVLPAKNLNGPSGRALDDLYLKPLGLTRNDTWLCDLIPETRLNPNQKNAINRHYKPLMKEYDLPKVTIPKFQQRELESETRRKEILDELFLSQARTLILLGDLPIKWFLNYFSENKTRTLTDFGNTPETYGKVYEIELQGRIFKVLPLCHPRQAQRLGASSKVWHELHKNWVDERTNAKEDLSLRY